MRFFLSFAYYCMPHCDLFFESVCLVFFPRDFSRWVSGVHGYFIPSCFFLFSSSHSLVLFLSGIRILVLSNFNPIARCILSFTTFCLTSLALSSGPKQIIDYDPVMNNRWSGLASHTRIQSLAFIHSFHITKSRSCSNSIHVYPGLAWTPTGMLVPSNQVTK